MKVFGDQTTTDILPGQNVPHLTWGSGNFSIKNKLISISVYISFVKNFTQYCHYFYAFLRKKEKKLKMQKNRVCVVTPVVTVLIYL